VHGEISAAAKQRQDNSGGTNEKNKPPPGRPDHAMKPAGHARPRIERL
jgi:hypothetical protein